MSALHVLVDEGDRQDEVQVEGVDNVSDHADTHRKCRIFEICQLNVHGSELHAPANI